MYSLIRPLLFQLDPEFTHHLSLNALAVLNRLGGARLLSSKIEPSPVQVMGLNFSNRVGLAAGLDKNGDYFNALGSLGFGFVEIGTVTPRPQTGNDKPRLFRIPERQAIINRMGFNNKGVAHLVDQVKKRQYKGVLGINIGKNAVTPVDQAVDDYRQAMSEVYPYADYITVNISSPNTPGLRALQYGDQLKELLSELKRSQSALSAEHGRYVPLAVKIAPDLTNDEIKAVARVLREEGMDGVIATNTTLSRATVDGLPIGNEAGGLSGQPLTEKSTEVIEQLFAELGSIVPIIGVGGIMNGEHAAAKIKAGAKLVQIYTGFIYRGPVLIAEAADAIASKIRSANDLC